MDTEMQKWQAENELFLAWCKSQGICPDDGAPENSGTLRRDGDGTEWRDHECDPSQWRGPAIPEGLSQYPPGMSVD